MTDKELSGEEKKKDEYELIIVFRSKAPFDEIRNFIVDDLLDNFDNLQMWDFKRNKDGTINKLKQEIEQLKAQSEKMKCCWNCKHPAKDSTGCCCPFAASCHNRSLWEMGAD